MKDDLGNVTPNIDLETNPLGNGSENPLDGAEGTPPTGAEGEGTGELTKQPGESTAEFKLRVKYNKEDKELSMEEAVEYAQKGMNYDKLKERAEALENHPGMKFLERQAQASGKTVEELVAQAEKGAKIKELSKKYGTDDEDVLESLYEQAKKADEYDRIEAKRKAEEEKTNAEKQKKSKDNEEFIDYYKKLNGKDVDVTQLPKEIFMIAEKDGISLKQAYMQYELESRIKDSKIDEINNENAKATPSVAKNSIGANDIFTEESVANMSPREMSKHWNNPAFRKVAGLSPLQK